MKSWDCSSLQCHIVTNIYSPLFKSSTLTVADESPVTHCWTSFPATSRCCTAGSRRLVAASEEAAQEHDLAPLAVGNGAWTPSADKRRNRRVRRSRDPFRSSPSPWPKNAETSRKDIVIVSLEKLNRFDPKYIDIFLSSAMFKKYHDSQQAMCLTCQYAALGWGSRAQQLAPAEAKHPQVSEEAEGRWPRMAELHEALEGRHPPDRGWEMRTVSSES